MKEGKEKARMVSSQRRVAKKTNDGLESITVLSFCPIMIKNGEITTTLSTVGSSNLAREKEHKEKTKKT